MRIFLFLAVVVFATIPQSSNAEELNAGFVQGLWYSQETVFADAPVRIYAAIRNNTGDDITGRVEFYVNDTRIARTDVQALNGRIVESWADWTPSYGTSTVRAVLNRIKLTRVGSSTQPIAVTAAESEDVIFVDYDTDGDGTGNTTDTDDDGDGISDEQEVEDGTNPLIYDAVQNDEINEDESGDTSEEAEDESDSETNTTTGPQGLEQYLTESRADTMLAQTTEIISNTKKKVDAHRADRNQKDTNTKASEAFTLQPASGATTTGDTTSASSSYNEDGFGEITRTDSDDKQGVFASLISGIMKLISAAYTFVLFSLSTFLAHPALVQLVLLFLIIFIIYKLAKRLSKRPE